MKDAYFTDETIGDLGSEWFQKYARKRKNRDQPFDIKRAGLLILDMQRYFLEPSSHAYVPSGEAIIPALNELARTFRQEGRPVFATRHENQSGSAGMMDSWWSELLTNDHALVDLHVDLDVKEEEIIPKAQYDAFYESVLEERLDHNNVSQVVIGGVMTHLCCETTARSAFVRGFEVFFLIDGTATYNHEYHTATLKNLAHGVAVLTTVGSLQTKD
jgi:isochorismate hydrolase